MELNKVNSLVELFFEKYKDKSLETHDPFLQWLKPGKDGIVTWSQAGKQINILSDYLKKNLLPGDRCILLSENRPEWLIADVSIMNAGGVTVPLFTTYSDKDYEYIKCEINSAGINCRIYHRRKGVFCEARLTVKCRLSCK